MSFCLANVFFPGGKVLLASCFADAAFTLKRFSPQAAHFAGGKVLCFRELLCLVP